LDNALAAEVCFHGVCRIYERAGFKLVATKEHDEFGKTRVGKTWEPDLGQQSWQ
jgi:hypothetical protein